MFADNASVINAIFRSDTWQSSGRNGIFSSTATSQNQLFWYHFEPILRPSRTDFPHVNQNLIGSVHIQHPNGHHIIKPRKRPIRRRFKLSSQQYSAVFDSRALRLHVNICAVVSLEVVSGIGPSGAARIHEKPICTKVEDLAYAFVKWPVKHCATVDIGEPDIRGPLKVPPTMGMTMRSWPLGTGPIENCSPRSHAML
jgi:hypothetical protein